MPPENQSSQTTPRKTSSSGNGPLFGAFIILIVLLFGAFYFWDEHLKLQARNSPPPYIPSDTGSGQTQTEVISTSTATTTGSASSTLLD